MQEKCVSKGEKTPWTRARPRLWVPPFMLGIVIYIFKVPLPLNFWRATSVLNQSYNNMTTEIGSYFVAYPHQYTFRLDEPIRCQQESPFLVLMIPVAIHNREARDIIRNTWGKETTVLGKVVSHFFLLGVSREGDKLLDEEVLQESRRHKDILQSSFVDSYNNLTIKTMVMFEWLSSHCPNTSYAMKVDSDIFLNVQKLVDMLLKAPQHRYLTGHVVRYAAVIRDQTSKWFLPVSAFPEPTYPPYAQGLGYVFSLDLPQKILEASLHVKAIYIEDVYVGLCLRHIGIALTDPPHSGLFMEMMPLLTSSCYWTSVITTIPGSSQQLLDVWGMYETQTQSGC
ncbi:beta-1,3-galactosyltransferase 2-like isoform X1 [Seriola aureovittata]|uniref:beta-1,3-galactosyltransferase 2-like isoform X1 n=1 Tax=Seriola aureovittata TaxID=2871759 RepID=UPI0024BEE946|nr:beta-1,3-galactosyltransferase 2-like isoform X1 [Seriola aureovittata]